VRGWVQIPSGTLFQRDKLHSKVLSPKVYGTMKISSMWREATNSSWVEDFNGRIETKAERYDMTYGGFGYGEEIMEGWQFCTLQLRMS